VLVGVLMAVLVYSALFPLLLTRTIPYPELVFPILAFLAGQLTGMAFPLAVTLSQGSPARVTGRLYGADLVGGCLGALLGAVFFIPLLGIPQTCAVVGLVAIAGLLALI
jgi:spermidine synthase